MKIHGKYQVFEYSSRPSLCPSPDPRSASDIYIISRTRAVHITLDSRRTRRQSVRRSVAGGLDATLVLNGRGWPIGHRMLQLNPVQSLVGGFTPSEKYWSIRIIIPNIWKNKTCSKPPTS